MGKEWRMGLTEYENWEKDVMTSQDNMYVLS